MTIAVSFKNRKNRLKIPVLICREISKTKMTMAKAVPRNKISKTESTHIIKTKLSGVTESKHFMSVVSLIVLRTIITLDRTAKRSSIFEKMKSHVSSLRNLETFTSVT